MHHRHHDDFREDLRDQIASLSNDVAKLRKQMMRRGRGALHDSRHLGEDLAEMMRDYYAALPDFRRNAYKLQRTAEAHPATTAGIAAMSVIVLGLAASLLMRR